MTATSCKERIKRLATFLEIPEDSFGKIKGISSLEKLMFILEKFRNSANRKTLEEIEKGIRQQLFDIAQDARQSIENGSSYVETITSATQTVKDCGCHCIDCRNFEYI